MLRWQDDDYSPYRNNELYQELMEITKQILEGMALTAEGIYAIAQIEGITVTPMLWEVSNIILEINDVIPEEDTFYITVNVFPLKSKDKKYGKESILYCYKIDKEYIGREVLFSPNLPAIYDEGEDVLKEIISILKMLAVT